MLKKTGVSLVIVSLLSILIPNVFAVSQSVGQLANDYTVYYSHREANTWLTSGWADRWINVQDEFPVFWMTFTFNGDSQLEGSQLEYDKFREVMDIWESTGQTNIGASLYPPFRQKITLQIGTQELWDNWVNFITEFKYDQRLTHIMILGEPNNGWIKSGMSLQQAMQWAKDLMITLHNIKPDATYIFPYWGLCQNTETCIPLIQNLGIQKYNWMIIDATHPYFFPATGGPTSADYTNRGDYNMDLNPEQKIQWYLDNQIMPYVNTFGVDKIICGETFYWASDYDHLDEQRRWTIGIINAFDNLNVDFILLSMCQRQTFHSTIDLLPQTTYSAPYIAQTPTPTHSTSSTPTPLPPIRFYNPYLILFGSTLLLIALGILTYYKKYKK